MTIKPTLRENGRMMFPMKIEYTMGRDEFIRMMFYRILTHIPSESGEHQPRNVPKSRNQCLECLRDDLTEYGNWVIPSGNFQDDYSKEKVQAAEAEATAAVDRLFPELVPINQ